jgi:hypothetical protein
VTFTLRPSSIHPKEIDRAMTTAKHDKSPPRNIDAGDLWAQIITLPRAHRVVPFPRNSPDGSPLGDVTIYVLTGDEVNAANLSAEKFIREQYKKTVGEVPQASEMSEAFSNLYNGRATREILFRSCRNASACEPDSTTGVCTVNHDNLRPFFPTSEAVGKLSTDELAVLMQHYMHTQAEVGPIVSSMSQGEMDAWIEVLGEGGQRSPLALLSSGQTIALLMYMASRLYALQTGNCSPSTPLENDTSPE